MKRWFGLLIAGMIVLASLGMPAEARAADEKITISLDSRTISFTAPPTRSGNSVQVDAQQIFAADGLSWEVKNGVLHAKRPGLSIEIAIGSLFASVNDYSLYLSEGIRQNKNGYVITVADFAELTGKALTTSVTGDTLYLKSNLKDRIISLLNEENNTVIYEGSIDNGVRSGKGKLYVNGVLLYEGQFSEGVMNGSGKLYMDGRLIYTGGFADNAPHGIGVYDLPGDERYEGMMADGWMQGDGKLYRAETLLYDGDWVRNQMHGKGRVYDARGNLIYEGELEANKQTGYGIAFNNGVKTYQGDWVNGEREGFGFLFDEEGTLTAFGQFADNALNGSGTSVAFGRLPWYIGEEDEREKVEKDTAIMEHGAFVDGRMISRTDYLVYTTAESETRAAFDDNKVPNGYGRLYRFDEYKATDVGVLSSNQLIYEGEIENGLREGEGKAYEDGYLVYDGEFADDQRHGTGRAYVDGMIVYDGEWRDGVRRGFGRTFLYPGNVTKHTGTIKAIITEGIYHGEQLQSTGTTYLYRGDMQDGKITGKGTLSLIEPKPGEELFSQTGVRAYEGEFVNGRYEGEGKLYNEWSLIFEGRFLNGEKDGYGVEFARGIRVFQGYYKEGLREGPGTAYTSNGSLEFEGNYKDGLRDGYGKLYENGSLVYEGNFYRGQKHGFGIDYRNGVVLYEGEFVRGERADEE